MPTKGYTPIGFPNELLKEIKRFIEDKSIGYNTANEFVRDSARKLLRELKQLEQDKKK